MGKSFFWWKASTAQSYICACCPRPALGVIVVLLAERLSSDYILAAYTSEVWLAKMPRTVHTVALVALISLAYETTGFLKTTTRFVVLSPKEAKHSIEWVE